MGWGRRDHTRLCVFGSHEGSKYLRENVGVFRSGFAEPGRETMQERILWSIR